MKLWLDDKRPTPTNFDRGVDNIEDTKQLILNDKVEVLSIDNDLGTGVSEGFKLIDWIEEQLVNGKIDCFDIYVHSANPVRRIYINNVIKRINRYCAKAITDYEWQTLQENFPMFSDYVEECYADYSYDNVLTIHFDDAFYDLMKAEFGVDLTYGYIWSQLEIIENILIQRFEKD